MATLLLTSRTGWDTQALWRAAVARGWNVERLRGPRIPDGTLDPPIVFYTEAVYVPIVARLLKLVVPEPPEDWLPRLPRKFTQREIRILRMAEARDLQGEHFVKPPNDKSFEARVYSSGLELPSDVPDESPVLVSEPVKWDIEFRCFVRNRQVLTLSPYLDHGIFLGPTTETEPDRTDFFEAPDADFADAKSFAEGVLADQSVACPDAFVLDVGRLSSGDWAVVEANAATSSGIYGCDPDKILDVLSTACRPMPS